MPRIVINGLLLNLSYNLEGKKEIKIKKKKKLKN